MEFNSTLKETFKRFPFMILMIFKIKINAKYFHELYIFHDNVFSLIFNKVYFCFVIDQKNENDDEFN